MLIEKILTQSNFFSGNERWRNALAGRVDVLSHLSGLGPYRGSAKRADVANKKRAASRPPVVNAFLNVPEYYLPLSSQPVIIALMCASGVWPAVDRYTCAMKKISTMNAAAVWKNATHCSDRYLSTPQSSHEP